MKKYSLTNTMILMALLVSISLLFIAIANKLILTQNFYDRNGEPMAGIPEMESTVYKGVMTAVYWYSAIYLLVKLLVISMILYTGIFYFDSHVSFRAVLRVVTLAELIFLVPAAFKIWWFYYHVSDITLIKWTDFYLLSLASLTENLKPVNIYPLQSLNAFEIAYWFLLAKGIQKLTGMTYDKSLRVVICSYLPALFLWIVVVVFFTMAYFPESY